MRLNAEIRYDAEPAAVSAMLLDTAFQDAKCEATGAIDHQVQIEEYDDGSAVVTTRRTMPTDRVPDFVRGFVGATLLVEQNDDWGAPSADGSREGTMVVEMKGAPVRLTGTLRLAPAPGGGTVETIEGDIKASVPLIGGRIEKAVEPALQAAIKVEQKQGRTWLAAH